MCTNFGFESSHVTSFGALYLEHCNFYAYDVTYIEIFPFTAGAGESFVHVIQAPNTFFVQLVRLSVCLCIVTVLVSLYNSVRVLEQPIISTATCSLFWVLFFTLASVK